LPEKAPLSPERLQKLIARAGVCSRREAEVLIREGRVTVNGRRAELGDQANLAVDSVKVDGKRLKPPEGLRYLLLYKPDGVVTTTSDESIEMTKRLSREEGIFCGISSGCNVAAAVKLSRKHPGLRRIATMINDSGGRYLSTEVFGARKEKSIPRTSKPLDPYTVSQLAKYQKGFDIVE
jgi:threonine synthase